MSFLAHISKLIAVIFHPAFMPLYAFILYLRVEHWSTNIIHQLQNNVFWFIFAGVVIFSVILPLVSLNTFIGIKLVEDWHIKNHKERPIVLVTSAVFLIVLYYLFYQLESKVGISLFYGFFGFIMVGIVIALLAAAISSFWKISLHSLGISGLAGSFLGLITSVHPIINYSEAVLTGTILLLVCGLVASSRLILSAHSVFQVLVGLILGFTIGYLVVGLELYPTFS